VVLVEAALARLVLPLLVLEVMAVLVLRLVLRVLLFSVRVVVGAEQITAHNQRGVMAEVEPVLTLH
jgi:hypothetical protein